MSGTLGDAALALSVLTGRATLDAYALASARVRLETPTPRIALGIALRGVATAALDVSDGLSTDALRLAHASGVDVELNAAWIPMAGGLDDISLALSGGEDFVICFSLPPERAAPAWAAPVGRLIPSGEGSRLLRPDGSTVPLEATGWDHLA